MGCILAVQFSHRVNGPQLQKELQDLKKIIVFKRYRHLKTEREREVAHETLTMLDVPAIKQCKCHHSPTLHCWLLTEAYLQSGCAKHRSTLPTAQSPQLLSDQ